MSYKFDKGKLWELEYWMEMGLPEYRAVSITFQVDKRTYFRWMSTALSSSSSEMKCHIKQALERGRAKCNLRLVGIINRQIERGDGRLAWKFLQYLHPEAYA